MSQRPNRLILLLLAITLAVAPLRATLALPAQSSADDMSHCADMQHGDAMPGMHHMDDADDKGQQCRSGCNGDCCDNACSSCVHPVTALPGDGLTTTRNHHLSLKQALASRYSDRTVIPPLRPPASP